MWQDLSNEIAEEFECLSVFEGVGYGMHVSSWGTVGGHEDISKKRARQSTPEYLAAQRARQSTPEFKAKRRARDLTKKVARQA